jgi:hypothetical protein
MCGSVWGVRTMQITSARGDVIGKCTRKQRGGNTGGSQAPRLHKYAMVPCTSIRRLRLWASGYHALDGHGGMGSRKALGGHDARRSP